MYFRGLKVGKMLKLKYSDLFLVFLTTHPTILTLQSDLRKKWDGKLLVILWHFCHIYKIRLYFWRYKELFFPKTFFLVGAVAPWDISFIRRLFLVNRPRDAHMMGNPIWSRLSETPCIMKIRKGYSSVM